VITRTAGPATEGTNAVVSETRTLALAALGEVTTRVAHEMRNALGGIELYASLLAEQCAGDSELETLSGRLLLGVTQLHALCANILSVSRRPAHETAPVDAVRLLTETAEAASLAIRVSGVRLDLRAPRVKAWVIGDAEQLRQAVLNVVLNAIQASQEGGTLTLAARVTTGVLPRRRPGAGPGIPGPTLEIAVRDTGVGMDRATVARAFEPFFTTRPKGTGLGLSIVREITLAHGGEVTLASRPGHGTVVRLILPLAFEADVIPREPSTRGSLAPSDGAAATAGAIR
jgi:signal transduction histidine kinase